MKFLKEAQSGCGADGDDQVIVTNYNPNGTKSF